MNALKVCSVFVTILALAACDKAKKSTNTSENFTLSVTGTDFQPHHEQSIRMVLIDRDTRTIAQEQAFTIAADGSFSGQYEDALKKDSNYYIAYFADQNGNGSCENPPTDHTWTVKIDNVDAAKTINLSHNFNFSQNCHMFSNATLNASTGTEVSLTGKIALDASITDATDISAGQAIKGATVFVQGIPDQETLTDTQGNFTLALKIPPNLEGSELTEGTLKLVAWYTIKDDYSNPAKLASSRFGAITNISGSAGSIDMGQIALTRTNRVRVTVKSAVDDQGISGCTTRLFGFDFQIVSLEASAGVYEFDYLPEAKYILGLTCTGYEYKEFELEVVSGTDSTKWIELPVVKLQPM